MEIGGLMVSNFHGGGGCRPRPARRPRLVAGLQRNELVLGLQVDATLRCPCCSAWEGGHKSRGRGGRMKCKITSAGRETGGRAEACGRVEEVREDGVVVGMAGWLSCIGMGGGLVDGLGGSARLLVLVRPSFGTRNPES
jgi:hypothetical protein